MNNKLKVDFLVIGSGVAGLRMALELKKYGDVLILTKSLLKEGSTMHAQGGVAVVYSSIDKPKYHFADTINAGNGICNPEAVWRMVEEGPIRVKELIDWGVAFDIEGKKFDFTKEGAHRVSRVLHAGGDATGANIEEVLINKMGAEHIKFYENDYVCRLIEKDNEVFGAVTYKNGKRVTIFSKAVFIATGGIGQLYTNTTNPPVSTGDGIAFSFLSGADIMDSEFIQFHPTSLAIGIYPRFLISEAVRGEGAILVDEKGEPFMERYHPMKDLAARDIVSRAIYDIMKKRNLKNVWLDISPIGLNKFSKRFPTIYKTLITNNVPLDKGLIPVVPAAHYFMGGVRIDLNGKTSLKNLFAAGEVSCNGLHGANRLASNSLLESLVFAKIAAENGKYYRKKEIKEIIFDEKKGIDKKIDSELYSEIRLKMETNAGIIRNMTNLKKNVRYFKNLWKEYGNIPSNTIEKFRLKNMIINGFLISYAALQRKESRGAHFRSDFSFIDNRHWKRHQILNKKEFKWIK